MKRIVIDADDRIVEVLSNLCRAFVIDGVSRDGDSSVQNDAVDDIVELFDGDEKEVAWQVID